MLALIVALVVYGNAKTWWDLVVLHTTAAGSLFGIGAGVALVLAILVVGCLVARVDPAALGLAGDWRASLRLGLSIGGPAALLGGAVVLGGALIARVQGIPLSEVTPAASVEWGPLLWRALLLLWVDTVVPEELAFRGALLLALVGTNQPHAGVEGLSYRTAWVELARASVRPAVLVSSVAFAAWHVVVVLQDGVLNVATIAGKLVVIAVGGMFFGGLRVLGGNLLAPIVGHWMFDVVAMIAVGFAVRLDAST